MIRINLLPSAHRRKKTINIVPLMITAMVVVLALGGGGFYVYQNSAIRKLEGQQRLLTQVMEDYNRQKARLNDIRKALADLDKRLSIKSEILKDSLDVPALMAELSAFTPKDVQFTAVTLGRGALAVNVTTTSYASAANTLISLETAPSFANVSTSSASKSSDNEVTLSISASLVKGGEQDGQATDD